MTSTNVSLACYRVEKGLRMKRTVHAVCVIVFAVGLTNCQSIKVPQQDSHSAQPSFMETWRVYNHCTTTEDFEALMVDTLLLKHAINRMQHDEVLALFSPMQSLISPSPVRLAADPRAMTAACTMRTAETALANGWNDLSITLYQSIVKDFSGPSYGYYRAQANAGLTRVLQHLANLPAP